VARDWTEADDQRFKEALEAGIPWDAYENKLRGDALDPEVAELEALRQARHEQRCGKTDD
jgi:hypothetical protein